MKIGPYETLKRGVIGEWSPDAIMEIQRITKGDIFILAGYKELGKLLALCNPLRGVFVWHKPNAAPALTYPAKIDVSFIVWAGAKSSLYGYQHWGSMVFSVPFPQAGCMARERIVDETKKAVHPCQGPIELYEQLIRPLPEEAVILDPYVGTGTSGIACARLGRPFIGFEIDPDYFRMASDRIRATEKGNTLAEERAGQGNLFSSTTILNSEEER